MYFFVPYNISPIQQAIQAGHAALEYANKFGGEEIFIDFVRNWKTWIILNGGTTNEKRDFTGISSGTLNQIGDELLENDINFSYFKEPDLNDALTALCFIADERVFNYEDYPDFLEYLIIDMKYVLSAQRVVELRMTPLEELIIIYPDHYKKWLKLMGGEKNVFLRDIIRGKKLA